LLDIFFAIHDPTTLNRQGNDTGTQYRSAIFYHSPQQKQVAEEAAVAVTQARLYPNQLVTEIVPAGQWYEAEAYHQEYFARNSFQGYCTYVVGPKVAKFRRQFESKLKT
jgi:peptide-methionine (S)-S-oxide reductase